MSIGSSRPGQADKANSATALFATKWSASVLEKFLVNCKAVPFCVVEDLVDADTFKFNYTWNIDAGYHAVDQLLEGSKVAHNQKAITIYRPVLSHFRLDKYDKMLNHFNPESPYITQQADILAQVLSKNIWLEGLLGANQSANTPVLGAPGGSQITLGNLGSSNTLEVADALYEAATEANITFDENNVPDGQKYIVVKPRPWHSLAAAVQDSGFGVSNTRYDNVSRSGDVININGIQVIKDNSFPAGEDHSSDTDKYQYHQFNATNSVGLAFCQNAIALVRRLEIFTEMEYLTEYQHNLVVSGYMAEPGWLRPECLIELQSA